MNSPAPQTASAWVLSVYADEICTPDLGLEPALELLNRHGIRLLDVRVVNGRDNVIAVSDDEVSALAALLQRFDLKVAALETSLFKCSLGGNVVNWGQTGGSPPGLSYEQHLALFERTLQVAQRLGTTDVRCFSFWREKPFEAAFTEVVEKLGRAADRARSLGLALNLQNQQDTTAATGSELARILRAVNSPSLRAAFHMGNSARMSGHIADDLEALSGLIARVTVAFQVIDVRCGWAHGDADQTAPVGPFYPYYFWHQPGPPGGTVQIGEARFRIDGPRTFLRAQETVGVDYRAALHALKRQNYRGPVSVDTAYFLAGAGATTKAEIETNFEKTVASLRQLIAEVCS